MASNDVLGLQQPLKAGGIRSVNFFNGRLLTGKDLSREQAARRESDARLGLAIGDGVAFGLEATPDATAKAADPVLRVTAGCAVNRLGQTLRLTTDTRVALARRFDVTATECVFDDCQQLSGGTYIAGAGVYVLTIAPAQLSEGRAPTNGLDPSAMRCNTDATVEAVQFRLLSVNPLRYADLDSSSPQFRNRLAYRCFGVEEREMAGADPFRAETPSYGLVDELRSVGLSDADVPLALVFWTASGLDFVDTWAVRRALLAPDALAGVPFARDPLRPGERSTFAFLARRRRLVEAHAMCAQFEYHLADLLATESDPATTVIAQHVRWLPPFGVVPLRQPPLRGFGEASFFSGIVRRAPPGGAQTTEFIDARLLGALQELALANAPIDVTQKEFIRVYRPWQNVRAAGLGQSVQLAVAFASGLLPDLAIARADMARFDFSNYAACCGA